MNPHNRLIWSLGCALVLWLPAAYGMISGSLDIPIGGGVFVGTLLFGYIGTGIVSSIWTGYRRSTDEAVERAKREIVEIERRNALEEQRRRQPDERDT